MRIKTKLTLGVGLLFALILLLSVVATLNITALKNDTVDILTANHNTLRYARNMLLALDEQGKSANEKFETNLQKQEKNITETGEGEATSDLRKHYESYKKNPDSVVSKLVRNDLFQIMELNMQAIQGKSEIAKTTADNALLWIAICGTLCFLIAFTLLVNLPSNIADPIKELSESIKQIASKNYSERVHFESSSEFGELAKSFNVMAEKLEEYNQSNLAKLMMEKKRIETLINNMHDPVIGLDEKFKVIFANEKAIKISGLTQADFIGKPALELAVKNDLIRTLMQDLLNGNAETETKPTPLKIFSENKESYFEKETLHISIIPTGEQTPLVVGHVIFLRNVTSYKELDFAKTNFIANVSHEFKTPIASMKMSLQLLENAKTGTLNEEQTQLVHSIQDDTTRLLNITGELLNMTQVESGNIQLNILATDPKEILNYAVNAIQTQADQKEIKIQIECPEHVSKVQADTEKTAWVLTNLLSNAVRYSYENSTIYLKIEEIAHQIQISVRDTGQGISPQYKDKIFDRYFRVPGTKKEGTGLGLAISKEFMEAQGGQISVESEYGSGSTFSIYLNTSS